MVTLRCTRKLLNFLGIVPDQTPQPPSGSLGDWYANLVPTAAGALIIFVNERSLLTVAVPEWEAENLIPWFRLRVANLLGTIGISAESVSREVKHLDHVQFARTASRRILGSLNDLAWNYQWLAEDAEGEEGLSLSHAELHLSQMPQRPLGYKTAVDVAKELLEEAVNSAG
jgi:hypothetical protein